MYTQRSEFAKQIPGFWLKVLKDNRMTATFIYEQDETLLKHLIDIRCIEDPNTEKFKLEFEFTPNEFMENKILTKEFEVEGDEVEKGIGTEINWKNSQNLTQKIKKVKKKGKKGKVNNVTKVVDAPSFFRFFKTTSIDDDPEEMEEEDEEEEDFMGSPVEEDFELGNEIRDEIVPNAALYYLNVRHDEESDSDAEKGPKGVKIDGAGGEKADCKQQ